VVHNGCTTGFETAVPRVPLVSFQPGGWQADVSSNRLGRVAHDIDELSDLITMAHDPTARARWFSDDSDAILSGRFAALDGRLAADRLNRVGGERRQQTGFIGPHRDPAPVHYDLAATRQAGEHEGAGLEKPHHPEGMDSVHDPNVRHVFRPHERAHRSLGQPTAGVFPGSLHRDVGTVAKLVGFG
jgi:hypothetical protein